MPVEKIIEVEVENKIYVDKPYETIIEKPYEVVRENLIFNEKIIDVDEKDVRNYPGAKILETEVEYIHEDKIVERPIYIDNIIEKEVRIPVEKVIEVPKEVIKEKFIP